MQTMLMGDLINSKKYDPRHMSHIMQKFKNEIEEQYGDLFINEIVPKIGDEYQCLCISGSAAIELAFVINEYFLEQDLPIRSRFVIAQGLFQGELHSPNWRFSQELYEAHELLNDKNKERPLVSLKYSKMQLKLVIENLLLLVDKIQSSWKTKDSLEIIEMIKNDKFGIIAKNLNKTKQQVERRYKTLQITEYKVLKKSILELCSVG